MRGNGAFLVVFHQILQLLLSVVSWGAACPLAFDSVDLFWGGWLFAGQIQGPGCPGLGLLGGCRFSGKGTRQTWACVGIPHQLLDCLQDS